MSRHRLTPLFIANEPSGTQFAFAGLIARAHRPKLGFIGYCHPEGRMSTAERFAHLLREFERVGVDPNTISAGLAVSEQDVLRALAALPDGAGPSAFLSQLRSVVAHPAGTDDRGEHRNDLGI